MRIGNIGTSEEHLEHSAARRIRLALQKYG